MPERMGGDMPDPINTETEYAGKVPTVNGIGDLGPEARKLKNHEKLSLGYQTGQEEDPEVARKSGFMFGVDPDYPETDVAEHIPENYRSEDYLW